MIDIKKLCLELSSAVSSGYVNDAARIAEGYFKEFCRVKRQGNTVTAKLGEGEYKLLLDAHIDEIAFVVTDVDEEGFVTLSSAGGIDPRILPCKTVDIHSHSTVTAVFCSTPPHLSGEEKSYDKVSDIKLDTLLGERAREIVSLGDIATFHTTPKELLNGRICGKSLDNRAGVAALILLAERLSKKQLPFEITILLSDQEELGLRGARTSAFSESPSEAVVVDVSFAVSPDVSALEGGEMSKGVMIGVAPSLDRGISKKLTDIAKENKIPYQTEVMGGTTGTNADVISVSKSGVPTSLLSIPLRNMHTDVEIIDTADILSVVDLMEKYIEVRGAEIDV